MVEMNTCFQTLPFNPDQLAWHVTSWAGMSITVVWVGGLTDRAPWTGRYKMTYLVLVKMKEHLETKTMESHQQMLLE